MLWDFQWGDRLFGPVSDTFLTGNLIFITCTLVERYTSYTMAEPSFLY